MIHILIPDIFQRVDNIRLVFKPISVLFNEQMDQRNARKLNFSQVSAILTLAFGEKKKVFLFLLPTRSNVRKGTSYKITLFYHHLISIVQDQHQLVNFVLERIPDNGGLFEHICHKPGRFGVFKLVFRDEIIDGFVGVSCERTLKRKIRKNVKKFVETNYEMLLDLLIFPLKKNALKKYH